MALTKLVNGQRVTMDVAEEAAIRSEWGAWVPPVPLSAADRAEQAIRHDPVLLGLARHVLNDATLTEQQLVDAVKAKL